MISRKIQKGKALQIESRSHIIQDSLHHMGNLILQTDEYYKQILKSKYEHLGDYVNQTNGIVEECEKLTNVIDSFEQDLLKEIEHAIYTMNAKMVPEILNTKDLKLLHTMLESIQEKFKQIESEARRGRRGRHSFSIKNFFRKYRNSKPITLIRNIEKLAEHDRLLEHNDDILKQKFLNEADKIYETGKGDRKIIMTYWTSVSTLLSDMEEMQEKLIYYHTTIQEQVKLIQKHAKETGDFELKNFSQKLDSIIVRIQNIDRLEFKHLKQLDHRAMFATKHLEQLQVA